MQYVFCMFPRMDIDVEAWHAFEDILKTREKIPPAFTICVSRGYNLLFISDNG